MMMVKRANIFISLPNRPSLTNGLQYLSYPHTSAGFAFDEAYGRTTACVEYTAFHFESAARCSRHALVEISSSKQQKIDQVADIVAFLLLSLKMKCKKQRRKR